MVFGGLALVMGLGLAVYVNHFAAARLDDARAEVIRGITRSIAGALAANLGEREREVALLSQSSFLIDGPLDGAAVRTALDRLKQTHRQYAWVGVADADGRVRAAADGVLEGVDVSARPWFAGGMAAVYQGDVHTAVLLAKLLKADDPDEPLRFVDFAAPIHDRQGQLKGVLATHAHWSWVTDTIRQSLPRTAVRDGIDVFVVDRHGGVLYPYDKIGSTRLPAGLLSETEALTIQWADEGAFLTSVRRVRSDSVSDLGWRVIVRQPVARAQAPVRALQREVLLISAVAAVCLMGLAYRVAVGVSRPVERLATAFRRIAAGDERASIVYRGSVREIRELADALRSVTDTLIARKHELEQSNATLEHTVAERTAQLRLANEQLSALARRDALTGLGNRLSATEHLRTEYLRMKRSGRAYAVLMADVDHFKRVNDRFGHEAGDQTLRRVAQALQSAVRATDVVARYGGEEFVVVLPATEHAGAVAVAEKIRQAVAALVVPVVGQVSLSIGLAVARPAAEDELEVVARADDALYRAKAGGRDRVVA